MEVVELWSPSAWYSLHRFRENTHGAFKPKLISQHVEISDMKQENVSVHKAFRRAATKAQQGDLGLLLIFDY